MSKRIFIRVEVFTPEDPTPAQLEELGHMELHIRGELVLSPEVTLEHALGFFERVSDKVQAELLFGPN